MTKDLEIGMTYKRGHRHFICVDEWTLLTFMGGKKKLVTPKNKTLYKRQPSVSANEIAKEWGVDLTEIDEVFRDIVKAEPPRSATPRVRPPNGAHQRELEVYKCFFAKPNGFRYNGM